MSLLPGRILPANMDQRQFETWCRSQLAIPYKDVQTFTPTWGGFSVDPVGDVQCVNLGAFALLVPNSGAGLSGTSSSTSFTLGGIPTGLRPTNNQVTTTVCIGSAGGGASGSFSSGAVCGAEVTSAGGITFYVPIVTTDVVAFNSSKWGASGTKGWLGMILYPLM